MKDYTGKSQNTSRVIDKQGKVSRQRSISETLQVYQNKTLSGELLQRRQKSQTNSRCLTTTIKVVQLSGDREKNPYIQSGGHEGYELTAHHIVPHSKLKLALDYLDKYDKSVKTTFRTDVLRSSIPSVLTKENVINIGIFEDSKKSDIKDEWLVVIQQALAGTHSTTIDYTNGNASLHITPSEINGITLDTLRNSFYEWQGGNQFMGPSTDLREEPGSKDEIDFDAQWITTMSPIDVEKLTGLRHASYRKTSKPGDGDLNKGDSNGLGLQLIDVLNGITTEIPSQDQAEKLKGILNDILAITRDVVPTAFDAALWKEITNVSEFENLESGEPLSAGKIKKWGRKKEGVTEHAFFRIISSAFKTMSQFTKTTSKDSNTAYDYQGTPIPGSKIKTTGDYQIYLPVKGSKEILPAPIIVEKTVRQALTEKGCVKNEVGDDIEVDDTNVNLVFVPAGKSGRKFTLAGYKDLTIFVGESKGTIKIKKEQLEKSVKIVSPNPNTESLYDFCKRNPNVILSTYMPKRLYDFLNS